MSTRVAAGVPTGGQFASTGRAESLLTLPRPVPDRIWAIAEELLMRAEDVDFPDHSDQDEEDDDGSGFYEDTDERATLADMGDPDRARENCYVASSAIQELIFDIDPDTAPGLAQVLYSDGPDTGRGPTHFTSTVTDPQTGEAWAIDFTARQFGPEHDFPLVEPLDDWRSRIDAFAADQDWAPVEFVHEH